MCSLVEVLGGYSNPSLLSRIRAILAGQSGDRASDRSTRSRQFQRRLRADEVRDLISAYAGGLTIDELAATFEIHRTTVLGQLKRNGVPGRTGTIVSHLEEAQHLYEQGWSLKRVGEHFGVDAETVRQTFKRAGVKRRSRPGWKG